MPKLMRYGSHGLNDMSIALAGVATISDIKTAAESCEKAVVLDTYASELANI
jgi:hypothetical protein